MNTLHLQDSDVKYLLSVLDEYPQYSREYQIREDIYQQVYAQTHSNI